MFSDIFKDVSVTVNEHKKLDSFSLKDIQDLVQKCKELRLNSIPPEPVFLESELCADKIQFRFPRSKKKRIRNKWAKRDANYKIVPWKHFLHFEMDNKYIGHPSLINKLKAEIPNEIRGQRANMCMIDDFMIMDDETVNKIVKPIYD